MCEHLEIALSSPVSSTPLTKLTKSSSRRRGYAVGEAA